MKTDMTYHLEPNKPLVDELREVADDQLGRACDSLDKADEDLENSVHDLRKRMKKLRGLLRLVRPGLEKTYRVENRVFRDTARLFSDIRDAQVLAETIDSLAEHVPGDQADEMLAPVRDWAAEKRHEVLSEKGVHDRLAEAGERLAAARARVEDWEIAGAPADVLRGGLKKTYKRARKRFHEAQEEPEPALLHEWRKRVKYHWYHCRLLREAWPEVMTARADALDELGDLLGDDHDLVVLSATLRDEAPDSVPPSSSLRFTIEAATDRSLDLRRRAFALAPQLMVEKKGALARRIAGYWTAATAMPRAG